MKRCEIQKYTEWIKLPPVNRNHFYKVLVVPMRTINRKVVDIKIINCFRWCSSHVLCHILEEQALISISKYQAEPKECGQENPREI